MMVMVCSGQPVEVHKAAWQARTHPQPSPAWRRWCGTRTSLDALDGQHCIHSVTLEAQEFRVRYHPSDVLHPGGSWRHPGYDLLVSISL